MRPRFLDRAFTRIYQNPKCNQRRNPQYIGREHQDRPDYPTNKRQEDMGKKDHKTGRLNTQRSPCGTCHRLCGIINSPRHRSNEQQFHGEIMVET